MTTTTTILISDSALPTPNVRRIATNQPWEWLAAGWNDLWRAPSASIAYGLLFVLMGYLLVSTVEGQFHSALALTTGFLSESGGGQRSRTATDVSEPLEIPPSRADCGMGDSCNLG